MVSGAVLAGGKATRMGKDKALLRIDGETLLARAVTSLVEITDDVLVVGRSSVPEGVSARAVPDARPGAGSLGGIYSALLAAHTSRCLVVACDMPFLNRRLLSYLLDLSAGYDLVIPRLDDLLEPLHAVYAKTCLPPIEALLARGDLRILDFFDQVRVRYVDRPEIERFDPHLLSFFNVNTREQLAQALAMLAQAGGKPNL